MIPLSDGKTKNFPIVNLTIIFINIVVFVLEILSSDLDSFIDKYALIPSQLRLENPSHFINLFTSMFLHAGFAHIIFNMWFLYIFGDNVEDEIGSFAYLIFYILGGLVASICQALVIINSDIPNIGASGAISSVLGFYLVSFPENNVKGLFFPRNRFISVDYVPAYIMLFSWGVSQLFYSIGSLTYASNSGVAYVAHLSGFVFGLLIGYLYKRFSGKENFI